MEHPERIGTYRILQILGEGGMGLVYEAEQTEPVVRRVALKVMKPGLDTRQVLARFEAERQALAVMDHPNIAKVLDAGVTEAGRPYFVMELVKGIPLNDYCDSFKLSTRARLVLFVEICRAVQHAHQKGVIHRDLKPSNILVSEQDDRPVPKIIDFGVAKAISQPLTERTLVTEHGRAIGTPAYMSPEQAGLSGLDIDTRTDIYSLGVILYELLVGSLPVEPREVGGMPEFFAQLVMRETDPPTPSARFTSLVGHQQSVAEFRHTDPKSLIRELRGDLDWIVMKAMEKERARRYETANGLAMDIERHLQEEPVLARPPSAAYRLSKFVARNRSGVVAAAIVAIALAGGAVAATVGMVRATRAEAATAREAEALRQVSGFLVGLFAVNDPSEARGNSVTARELLDKAAERIDVELAEQPQVQARLMLTMGEAYQSLGLYDRAAPMLERGLAVRENVHGEDHLQVAEGLFMLAELFRKQGKYDEAERLYQRAMAIQEARLGPAAPALAATLGGLGTAYVSQGKFDEAEPLLERALAIREDAFAPDHTDVGSSLGALGSLYTRQGRYAEADSMFSRELVIREKAFGPDHPDVAYTLSDLGGVRWLQGNLEDADRFFRRSLDIRTRMLGPDHPELGSILNNLGVLAWTRGEYREAAGLYQRALDIYAKALGPNHIRVAGALNNIAETHWKLGNVAEGEQYFRRALAIKEGILEPLHPSLAITLNGLANLYRDAGRYADAAPLYRRALSIRETTLGATDRHVIETLSDWATMLRASGQASAADSLQARIDSIKMETEGGS